MYKEKDAMNEDSKKAKRLLILVSVIMAETVALHGWKAWNKYGYEWICRYFQRFIMTKCRIFSKVTGLLYKKVIKFK
jgi:hypothetical protein